MLIEKSGFVILFFAFFRILIFILNFVSFTWSLYSCDFMACELIKCNGFQISQNKPDETLRYKLNLIFPRKTTLKP